MFPSTETKKTGRQHLLALAVLLLACQPLMAQGTERALEAFMNLVIGAGAVLLIFLVLCIAFLFQRRMWQRIVTGLFALALYLFSANKLFQLIGGEGNVIRIICLAWMAVVVLVPAKKKKERKEGFAVESTPGMLGGEHGIKKICALVSLHLLMTIFPYITMLSSFYESGSFLFDLSFFLPLLIMLVVIIGILLFYKKIKAGWVLLAIYFGFVGINALIQLPTFFSNRIMQTDSLQLVFALLHIFYILFCLYLIYRPQTRLRFQIRKNQLYLTFGLIIALIVILAVSRF